MSVCRFLPEGTASGTPQKANIRIKPSIYTDTASAVWESLRIFYSLTKGKVKVTIRNGNNQLYSDTLTTGLGVQELTCGIKGARDLELEFLGESESRYLWLNH